MLGSNTSRPSAKEGTLSRFKGMGRYQVLPPSLQKGNFNASGIDWGSDKGHEAVIGTWNGSGIFFGVSSSGWQSAPTSSGRRKISRRPQGIF